MNIVALGLGSNLGKKEKNIKKAIYVLQNQNIILQTRTSSFLRSKAVLTDDAPQEWNKDFINCVIVGATHYTPHILLKKIKSVEKAMGRKSAPKWSPRIIDIDILLYSNNTISSTTLTIPHKKLLERYFALVPLSQIMPKWQYPSQGKFYKKTISSLVQNLF